MRALLPGGGEDLFQTKGNNVRSYDFRRPTKFKKDLLRTLVMVHDNYTRLLQSYFAASIRAQVRLNVRSTNQYSASEFLQLLPNPAVVTTFHMAPLPGTCMLEISSNIAFALIDRIFGGTGADVQPQRGLSEIELGVIQRVVSDMTGLMAEAWRNIAVVTPRVEDVQTNPIFLQSKASSEVVAVITIGMEVGEHMGHITLAFPYSTVVPVLAKLSQHVGLEEEPTVNEAESEMLRNSLTEAPVPIEVELGHASITVGDFSNLQVGDLIRLSTPVGGQVQVFVGDRLTFSGRPGVVDDRMAVQISAFGANRVRP